DEFTRRFSGTVRPVLLEHPRDGHPLSGFTDNYLKVEIDGIDSETAKRLDNTIAQVTIGQPIAERESVKAKLV
ncbi:MAG: hypothetical protein K2J10_05975, partial [Muribaculaceae bacterium]|nr:hypothetical protein [Muribaculaceae bacterium]